MAQLQALVRRLGSLTEMRQMERNRRDVSPAVVQASIDAVLAVLDAQVEATQEAIQGHIDGSPTLRGQRDLLTSVPGVAERTAAALLAELGNVSQFTGARQVAAFAGLVPRLRQSGQKKGHVCLSKVGTSRLRRALYLPAVSALRCDPDCAATRRSARSGRVCCPAASRRCWKMLIVGAAMRKLLQIAFGVPKSGEPFDQSICMAAPAGA